MFKARIVLIAVAVVFAALLTFAVVVAKANTDSVDTIVSLQAEDTADFGNQLVMEKPTGEKPGALYRTHTGPTDLIDAQGAARLIDNGLTGNLRPGISGLDLANLVLLRSTSATSQGEVSAHPGSINPNIG